MDWRGVAVLLAVKWSRGRALPVSLLYPVERDYGRLMMLLRGLERDGLIEVHGDRVKLVALTELGEKVADRLNRMAREAGLL